MTRPWPQNSSNEQAAWYNDSEAVNAYETGDVHTLQRVLRLVDDDGKSLVNRDLIPETSLLATAIAHRNDKVVEFLLPRYPSWVVRQTGILRIAFANPDLPTFRLLHSRSPDIINMQFEQSNSSALMEACATSDPTLPNYFLDNGADVSKGGYPEAGALYEAVIQGQPLSLVRRMVDLGAKITGHVVLAAISRQDTSVLGFILDGCFYDCHDLNMKIARQTNNEKIVGMVEHRALNLSKKERRIMAEDEGEPEIPTGGKYRWQLRKRTN